MQANNKVMLTKQEMSYVNTSRKLLESKFLINNFIVKTFLNFIKNHLNFYSFRIPIFTRKLKKNFVKNFLKKYYWLLILFFYSPINKMMMNAI